MEYCWHIIRRKVAELCFFTNGYGPRRALTPIRTAVKRAANERMRIELDLLRTTEWIMDEINWRVIDDK
jgi:hypothetical protein